MQTTMKKVKEGTRGQKQILKENEETLKFYRIMTFAVAVIYTIIMYTFTTITQLELVFTMFSAMLYGGSYQFMLHISRPTYSPQGVLKDCGADLNMPGGLVEHVKDLVILTAICQILSIISNYFWLLWLVAPVKAGWIVWKNFLSPYIFQQGFDNIEVDEKKQKKLERRMKKQHTR